MSLTFKPEPMVKGNMGRNMSATDASGLYTAVAAKHARTAPLAPRLGAIGPIELRSEGGFHVRFSVGSGCRVRASARLDVGFWQGSAGLRNRVLELQPGIGAACGYSVASVELDSG